MRKTPVVSQVCTVVVIYEATPRPREMAQTCPNIGFTGKLGLKYICMASCNFGFSCTTNIRTRFVSVLGDEVVRLK